MKVSKKVIKKLERRGKGHQDLLNTRNKRVYPGMYTAPGSRNLKRQG